MLVLCNRIRGRPGSPMKGKPEQCKRTGISGPDSESLQLAPRVRGLFSLASGKGESVEGEPS